MRARLATRFLASASGRERSCVFSAPFFNEFAVRSAATRAVGTSARSSAACSPASPLGDWFPELEDALLVCATEVPFGRDDLDRLAEALAA